MLARTANLPTPATFSLKATVLSHGWHECSPMSWSEGGRCFQVIERDRNRALRVSVTERTGRSRTNRSLRVVVDTDVMDETPIEDAVVERILRDLRLTLGLDRDLSEYYAICAEHPALAVIPSIGAGRLIRSASMTENILKALLATNVNWTQAVKMINRLGQLGPNLRHFRSLAAWPTPRAILRAGETYLKEVCRVGYRSGSVLKFCREVCDGEFDPESLNALAADPEVPSEAIVAKLRGISGIGPSSANYLLGFLGRHDHLSIDSATFAHVAANHTNGRKPTCKQIERIYAPFGRWKNLICWSENWLTWATAKGIIDETGA